MGDTSVRPGGDARCSVVGGDGVVDVEDETSFVASVLARDLGKRAGGARAGAGNAQLGTTNVVLSALKLLGGVHSNMLSTQQVVTSSQVLGEVDGEVLDAAGAGEVGGPLEAGRGDLVGGELVNLEPVTGAVVRVGGSAVRGLGHPHGQGAWVRDGGIDGEADAVTGGHSVSRGRGYGGRVCAFRYTLIWAFSRSNHPVDLRSEDCQETGTHQDHPSCRSCCWK